MNFNAFGNFKGFLAMCLAMLVVSILSASVLQANPEDKLACAKSRDYANKRNEAGVCLECVENDVRLNTSVDGLHNIVRSHLEDKKKRQKEAEYLLKVSYAFGNVGSFDVDAHMVQTKGELREVQARLGELKPRLARLRKIEKVLDSKADPNLEAIDVLQDFFVEVRRHLQNYRYVEPQEKVELESSILKFERQLASQKKKIEEKKESAFLSSLTPAGKLDIPPNVLAYIRQYAWDFQLDSQFKYLTLREEQLTEAIEKNKEWALRYKDVPNWQSLPEAVFGAAEILIGKKKSENGKAPCDLTYAERLAIQDYTGQGYVSVNQALRTRQVDPSTQNFVDIMASALDKIEPYVGLVKRGVFLPPESLDAYKVGAVVEYKAFTSASRGTGFASQPHRFTIASKTGRFIGPVSISPGEQEVLFPPNTKFKVLSVKKVARPPAPMMGGMGFGGNPGVFSDSVFGMGKLNSLSDFKIPEGEKFPFDYMEFVLEEVDPDAAEANDASP